MEKGTAVLGAGTRLGEYEIERLLGVGSMGAVYEAVCTATSQRFAIKVLSPALAAMPTARARFLNEAKLTARVRHPHIVDVSDVGEDAGRSYFVMELLNGEDLSRRLLRSGRLSVVETADIIVPVCDAVAEAHRRGVTHRDLKPSNIFLLIRGRRPHPVVLDFGIAKEEDAARAPRTGAATPVRRTVFGTPYYLAPEQIADHEAAGPASDQYALGVILYECLTGQPPFRGANVDEVFRAIAAGNPVPPIERRPDLPPEMNAIVLRALSPDPKARYFSVGELRQALLPFSSKATGSVPTLQSRAPSPPSPSPLSPSPTAPSPAVAREVEVQPPRSFVRTLTPEVEALEGAWFAAGEAPEESAGETAIPSLIPSPIMGRESEWEPSGVTVPPVEVESEASAAASGIGKLVPRRIWIGAAAGVAVVSLALAFAMKSGRSEKLPAPAAALVQIEPTQAAPVPAAPPASAAIASPAAPAPAPTAAAPAPSEVPTAAVGPSEAPTAVAPAPTEVPAAAVAAPSEAPAASAPTPAPSEAPVLAPPVPKEAPTAAIAPAPREQPAPPPRERAMPATTATATAIAPGDAPALSAPSPKRKASDKPRVRASAGVRMHNGVPLLD